VNTRLWRQAIVHCDRLKQLSIEELIVETWKTENLVGYSECSVVSSQWRELRLGVRWVNLQALPNVDASTQQYDVCLTAEKSRLSFRPTNWRVWKGLKSLARAYWLFLWPSRRRRNRTQTRQDATIKSRRFNGSLASRDINPQSQWLAAGAWYTVEDLWCNSMDGHDQISRNGQHQRSRHLWSVDQPEVVCRARRIYAPVPVCSFMIELKYYAGYDPCIMQGIW